MLALIRRWKRTSIFSRSLIGLIVGGILFVVLDQIVNAHGGFLRKTAATLAHLRDDKRLRMKESLEELSKFDLLRTLSPEHINALVEMIRPVTFYGGETIVKAGNEIAALYFIRSGTGGSEPRRCGHIAD